MMQPMKIDVKEETYFLNAIFYLHGDLNNTKFFESLKQMVLSRIDIYTK